MRRFRTLKLLASFTLLGALVGALASVRGGDDAKPADKAAIKLPGQASRGVLDGGHFYTIVGGEVMDVDLKQQKATVRASLAECYDYLPVAPFLDVADGKACVASGRGSYTDPAVDVIELSNGKVLHSAKYKGEVHGLGFAGDDRVFILDHADVVILDVASGETVQTIPIRKEDPNRTKGTAPLSVCQKVGELLYVADSRSKSVKVVDLDAGKVVDEMHVGYSWLSGLHVVGDKAFVRTINLSYGINNPQFGCFDLTTKKYSELKHPDARISDRIPDNLFDHVTLVAGPDGGVCLEWKARVYQFDGDGKQVGETPLDKDDDGRLVGVWNGRALTAAKDALRLTPLAKATAKGD